MPQLLHARANATFDNELWDTWFFTSNSEESMIRTPQDNYVALVVHGGGIFSTPERFRQLYLASTDRHSAAGFTGLFGGRILEQEAQDMLEGRCPDGSEIPVYSYNEFQNGIADLPRRYAIVMDLDKARSSLCGFATFDHLKEDPLMIARAGGVDAASAYLDKAKAYYGTTEMGSWHRFNDMDPMNPQTWVLFVYDCIAGASDNGSADSSMRSEGMTDIWFTHYRIPRDAGFGIRGDAASINTARYVAVAPRDAATSVRNLPFQS